MSGLWGSIKKNVGVASRKTQLRTELLLVDRELRARQQAFGVQLYDYVNPLSKHASFYASDDMLTATIRPPLLTAQREIAALEIKRGKLREERAQAQVKRAAAFPTPAVDWKEKIVNAGKSTAMAGNEAKLKTEASLLETQITHYKQMFGVELYPILEDLEDLKGWLPTDREIRSMYDNCRRDMEKIKKRKRAKEEELVKLGGPSPEERESLGNSAHEVDPSQEMEKPYEAPAATAAYGASPVPAPASAPLPPSSTDPFAMPLSSSNHANTTYPDDPFASLDASHAPPPSQPPPVPPSQPPPPPPPSSSTAQGGGNSGDLLW